MEGDGRIVFLIGRDIFFHHPFAGLFAWGVLLAVASKDRTGEKIGDT